MQILGREDTGRRTCRDGEQQRARRGVVGLLHAAADPRSEETAPVTPEKRGCFDGCKTSTRCAGTIHRKAHRCETMKEASVSRVTWNQGVLVLRHSDFGRFLCCTSGSTSTP